MKWTPTDIIIVLMTLTVCFIIGMAALMPLLDFKEIDHDKQKLLAGVVGSMLSIVSMYIGGMIQRNRNGTN